ncbi:MAG: hypothetical protein Q8L66_00695 [Caulobacter sp.]|nr:hypothetical protein [Caulobacter sp.]
MKKILIAAAAVATLAAAGAAEARPAHNGDRPGYGAQHGPNHGYRQGGMRQASRAIDARQAVISTRIQRGMRTGRLNPYEARALRGEFRQIARLEYRFRATRGLDRREVAILDGRLDRLERRVYAEMRDGNRNGARYGQGYGRSQDRRGGHR